MVIIGNGDVCMVMYVWLLCIVIMYGDVCMVILYGYTSVSSKMYGYYIYILYVIIGNWTRKVSDT